MKRTKTNKRRYLYRQPQKSGLVYVYFRNPRTRQLTRLPDDEASADFALAYDPLLRALNSADDLPPTKTPAELGRWKNERTYIDPKVAFRPASIGWFIERYKASKVFLGLSKGTRYNYGFALDLMKTKLGGGLLQDMTPQAVDVYSAAIDRSHGGSVADQQINLISNLWDFAKDFKEFKRGNKFKPTLGASRRYKHDGEGHLAWPDHVTEKFLATAKPHLVEIVNGLYYTGQRGSDLVKMKWADYNGELIHVIQQKTSEQVWINCPQPLKQMLDTMPRRGEFIFSSAWKRPYEHAGTLGCAIGRHLDKLKIEGYSMHGLRKNAGIALAEAGCSVPEIMAVLGHKSPKMAIFYVKQVEAKTLGQNATAKLNIYIDARKAKRIAERRAAIQSVK
jgi:Phage integrase family